MRHTTTGFVDSERTENGTNTPGESVTLKNGPSKDCKVVESHVSEHIEHVEEEELSDKTMTGCHNTMDFLQDPPTTTATETGT